MIETLVMLLIALLVLGVVWYIVTLLLAALAVPGPFITICKVIFLLIALLVVLKFLLPLAGMGLSLR